MALTTCRECGGQVSTGAERCPQCGVYRPARRARRTIAMLAGIIGILAMASIIGTALSSPATSNPTPPTPAAPTHRYATRREAQWEAYDGCRDAVLSQLKAPSEAKVSGMDDSDPVWAGDVLTFGGTVDAPNPFGVRMRATWMCKLRVTLDRITPLAFKLRDPMED